MKRVTGIGGVFIKARNPKDVVPGTALYTVWLRPKPAAGSVWHRSRVALIFFFTNTEPRRVGVPYLSEAASFIFPIMDVTFR